MSKFKNWSFPRKRDLANFTRTCPPARSTRRLRGFTLSANRQHLPVTPKFPHSGDRSVHDDCNDPDTVQRPADRKTNSTTPSNVARHSTLTFARCTTVLTPRPSIPCKVVPRAFLVAGIFQDETRGRSSAVTTASPVTSACLREWPSNVQAPVKHHGGRGILREAKLVLCSRILPAS